MVSQPKSCAPTQTHLTRHNASQTCLAGWKITQSDDTVWT